MKLFTATLFLLLSMTSVLANDYDNAWKAIHKKNYKEATILLQKAIKNPATSMDAYCTLLLLQTYQGKEDEINGFQDALIKNAGKNSYLYSLWFNGSVLGEYFNKAPYQLDFIDKIENDTDFNGSIQAATHYVKAMYYVFRNAYEKGIPEWKNMYSFMDWQFAAPFENLAGSGFYRQHGPLLATDSITTFSGLNNVAIRWMTPVRKQREGWVYCYPALEQSTAIVYAQSFVYAPEDTKAVLNAGVNGSLKVWINDGLVLSESKERVTEVDYYKNYCQLKKGYNRILVQLGYTANNNPNFIIRFTDDEMKPLANITSTSIVQAYTKVSGISSTVSIKHFAEAFFENKIKNEPANPVNYLLLSQTYRRDLRLTEARQVINNALKLAPEDPLLRFELLQILLKADNRTQSAEEFDWLKENDPGSYVNRQVKIQALVSEEKYEEANDSLDAMLAMYAEDENILQLKATVLGKLEKVDELLKLVDRAYKKYPSSSVFATMRFNVKKLVDKDTKAAMDVLTQYFENNYEFSLLKGFATEYKNLGQDSGYLTIIKQLYKIAQVDPTYANLLSQYYYEKQDYKTSLVYAKEANSIAPTVGQYWHNMAVIYEQLNNKEEAINNYKKAIYFNRTDYDSRKKLNLLLKKPELYKLLPETDAYALIKKAPLDSEYDFTYVLDEKGSILYDEGASEEYIAYAVKINTQKGIDSWKEITLPRSSSQSLLVEKCEVVKANGSKVAAERNETDVVFTGLQQGDAIYVKIRLQNYGSGRLGSAFWDKFTFNAFVNSQKERYTLIAPKDFVFNAKIVNSKTEPAVKDLDGFKVYTWEIDNLPPVTSEPLMPPLNDIGIVLHISTVKSWADISGWYSDIAYEDTKDNYELDVLYNDIFKDKNTSTDFEKAKRIYDYIVTNIRYSSVSFRQSGYVPQDISKIINTRLGDCKDLSSLFVALAAKAGIKAQLVLIDTRDNGIKDMQLPSMEFNHCISLAHLDGKDYYIELTDGDLPFGSLPANLNGALSLVVPSRGEKAVSELTRLFTSNRTNDKSYKEINVTITDNDAKMDVEAKRYGSIVSGWRNDYATLNTTKQKEAYEQSISNANKNPVKLEALSFKGLTGTGDSLITKYSYTVKNEVIDAGSLKMIKIPFIDLVATLESLSPDKRIYPIEYWNYEYVDEYETVINIKVPVGKQLLDIPPDANFNFKESTYSLKFVKGENEIKIIRKANLNRKDIAPEDYDEFKKFFSDIVQAESKYIVFK